MYGESLAVDLLAVLDLVLGDHQELAAVVLHDEGNLGTLLSRAHRIHHLGIGNLDRALRQRLNVEIGPGKFNAGNIPTVLIEPFASKHRGHVVERDRGRMAEFDFQVAFGFKHLYFSRPGHTEQKKYRESCQKIPTHVMTSLAVAFVSK